MKFQKVLHAMTNKNITTFATTDSTIKLAQSEFEKLLSSTGLADLKAEFNRHENEGYSLLHKDGVLNFSAPSAVEVLYAVSELLTLRCFWLHFFPAVFVTITFREWALVRIGLSLRFLGIWRSVYLGQQLSR